MSTSNARAPVASNRQFLANAINDDTAQATLATTAQIIVSVDAAIPAFTPIANTVYTIPVSAAPRTWTITTASARLTGITTVGLGSRFLVQNDGASTITLAGSGTVTVAAGHTVTVATVTSRSYLLTLVSGSVALGTDAWVLRDMGPFTN